MSLQSTRRPGRPPLDDDDESTSVHLRLPARTYDRLYERAQQERINVQEFIRRELQQNKKT